MDDDTFQGLLLAWRTTPDNGPLLNMVVDGCIARRDIEIGRELLNTIDVDALADDQQMALRKLVHPPPKPGAPPPSLRVVDGAGQESEPAEHFLGPERDPVSFADVGGLQDVKKRIHKKIILPQQRPGLFERFKRKAGGGVLMYGPPGCGKTLLARATAGETGSTFLDVRISDVLDMWFGQSQQKLKTLFDKARDKAPSVLFFDEVEALGGKRQFSHSGAAAKLVSQFLAEMDGFSSNNEGVLILAATNVPWAVDPAFRRPGRFDRVLFVPPPDRVAREVILRLHLADRPLHTDVDAASLAKRTSGYRGRPRGAGGYRGRPGH